MKKNMGSADRITRLIIAAVLLILYFTNVISGTIGIIALVIAIVFALTSVVNFSRGVGLNNIMNLRNIVSFV